MDAPESKAELLVGLKHPKNIHEDNGVCLSFSNTLHCVWLSGGRYSLRAGSGASVVFVPVDIVDNASLSVCVWGGVLNAHAVRLQPFCCYFLISSKPDECEHN